MSIYATSTHIDTGHLTRFILKGCAYAVYGLLVMVDGLNNPESYNSRFLTLPYLIGGLALTRSICEALDSHHDGHAALFALGLSTLGALS
ncbi:MAG: hypothetical protein ACPGSM_16435 [Thiolinea sp.]